MFISRFEEIKMLDDETFGEFYFEMGDLRNSMVSLGKFVSDVKLIRKILRSLPERFRIKVTTIEESKDSEEMKIGELVGSLQTYELSLPPVKKVNTIAFKASIKKAKVSFEEDSEKEEDAMAMVAKNFRRLMRNDQFKKKFFEKLKKEPKEFELEEAEKKDPRGPRCFECSGFGDIRADCGNLKQVGEFYSKMGDLRNSMVSLGKSVSDVKLNQKILRSLPERFRIKVTTIEESKDSEEMKIEELVGSLQTYELSLPPVKKVNTIAIKASKKKAKVSYEEDSEKEEDAVAMLAKNFRRLMRNDRFKKKFFEKLKKAPKESELEEAEKKDPSGPICFECSGFGHIWADCGNLKQGKGKAYNATLSDESEEEESPAQYQFLAFIATHEEDEDSYYTEHSDEDGEELKEAYKVLYVKLEKLRETCKQYIHELNSLQTKKSSLLLKIQDLEGKLLETQL
jgi:hypothetical protein